MCVVPPPDLAVIAAAFSSGFHDNPQQCWSEGPDSPGEQTRGWPVYHNALLRLRVVQKLKTSGRLLDVGCGTGAFIHAARHSYAAAGIDAEPAAADWCRRAGLDARCGDFVALDFDVGHFDVITLWDSLASMPDQAKVFRRIVELLAESGVAVLTVPDAGAILARVLGSRWPLMIPPINVAFHTRRSLESLGARVGLRLVRFRHPGRWVDAGILVMKVKRVLGLTASTIKTRRMSVFLNTGDIALAAFVKA
jgi:SAM-dependent methyltransferase